MPSTYSSNLLLELMADGENDGLWGEITNENLEIIGRAISGVTTVSLSGTTHTLTVQQGNLSEGHYKVLQLGGSPSGTNTITVDPNTVARVFFVENSSGQDVVFTQGSGGDVTVANGNSAIIYCDGAGASAAFTEITASFLRAANNLSDLDDSDAALQNLGLTATAAELNKLDGVTATAAELNKLDGVTATTTEINHLDGVTANVQTQLNARVPQTGLTGSAELPAGSTAERDGSPAAGYLRFNTTDGAFEGYNGTEWAGIGGGGIAYSTQTANYTATAGEGIIADTSGGSFTVTLPASPAEGDVVVIADGDDWSTNSLTVDRNGSTIEGAAENITMDVGAISVSFIYDGTTWQIYTQAGSYTASSSIEGFYPTTVSGASQSLDLGSFNFFDAGTLTADTTVSFTNVPTATRWSYTFIGDTLEGYLLEDASYDSVSFSVGSQDTVGQGLFFKPDGTKMYVVGNGNDSVYQYSLSTAWDVSTASYDSVSFSVGSQDSIPTALFFKPDGTKMYVVGNGNNSVYQYSLSTAWDVSTASYDSVSFSVGSQETGSQGLFFKPDGTKMYVVGNGNDSVYQYSLSTAWDVSTASYDSVSFSVGSQETAPTTLFFKPDGTKMYVVGNGNDSVYQYSLSTAWDVSTASYDSVSFSVGSQDSIPTALFFKPDGTKMYVVGNFNDSVYQYSTGTGITLTFPASLQNPPTRESSTGDRVTYDFYTLDGGTAVYLTSEEIE